MAGEESDSSNHKEEQPAQGAEAGDSDDSDDDTSVADSQSDATGSAGGQGGGAAGKKKKKKKGKKKKGKGTEGGESGASAGGQADQAPAPAVSSSATNATPQASKAEKQEAEKRFKAALTAAKEGDDMWITVNNTLVQDAKLKKLLDALKSNKTVTSLDLSQNQLTDEGASAIAAVLGMSNSAPELIQLDLRENSFTEQGLTILAGLSKVRKSLEIRTGSMKEPEPPPPPPKAGAAKGMTEGMPGAGLGQRRRAFPELADITKGPMFRKYFQGAGDDDDEPPGFGPEPSDPGTTPEELWGKLNSLSDGSAAASNITCLLAPLQQLCALLSRELSTLSASADALDGSRPFLKACLNNLHVLEELLSTEPRSLVMQHSRQPQLTVGTHRVWVSEAVALLMEAGNAVVDGCVAAAKLIPRVLHLAVYRPLCSALHYRALRLVRAAMGSRNPSLLEPLFKPGWGLDLKVVVDPSQGSSAPPPQEEQQLCPPLPELVIQQGTAAVGVVSGQRPPLTGFIVELSHLLQRSIDIEDGSDSDDDDSEREPDSDDEDSSDAEPASNGATRNGSSSKKAGRRQKAGPQKGKTQGGKGGAAGKAAAAAAAAEQDTGCGATVARALKLSSTWSEYTAQPGGAYRQLCTERVGDLGGPRAVRTSPIGPLESSSELADLGGGLVTGREILALLQNMNRMVP